MLDTVQLVNTICPEDRKTGSVPGSKGPHISRANSTVPIGQDLSATVHVLIGDLGEHHSIFFKRDSIIARPQPKTTFLNNSDESKLPISRSTDIHDTIVIPKQKIQVDDVSCMTWHIIPCPLEFELTRVLLARPRNGRYDTWIRPS